jgi:hypothetical protein
VLVEGSAQGKVRESVQGTVRESLRIAHTTYDIRVVFCGHAFSTGCATINEVISIPR